MDHVIEVGTAIGTGLFGLVVVFYTIARLANSSLFKWPAPKNGRNGSGKKATCPLHVDQEFKFLLLTMQDTLRRIESHLEKQVDKMGYFEREDIVIKNALDDFKRTLHEVHKTVKKEYEQ